MQPEQIGPLLQEWEAILRATGFGSDFVFWCMSIPELGPPPVGLPTHDYALTMLQMVTHECRQSLAGDARFRKQRIQYERRLDKVHLGSRQAYAAMRREPVEPLTEMHHEASDTAVVVDEEASVRAYVSKPQDFAIDVPVQIGLATARIVDRDAHRLLLQTEHTPADLLGEQPVQQSAVLFDAPHLFARHTDYWRQFWAVPDPDRAINPDLWIQAIRSIKPNTARGVDGLSANIAEAVARYCHSTILYGNIPTVVHGCYHSCASQGSRTGSCFPNTTYHHFFLVLQSLEPGCHATDPCQI